MKFGFISIFLLLQSCSVGAVSLDVPIKTHIVIPHDGTNIMIDYEKDTYMTVYKSSKNTFDDLVVPFKVKSQIGAVEKYKLTILDSYHVCDDHEIMVNTLINDELVQKNDTLADQTFEFSDKDHVWSNYHLDLQFPIINMAPKEQSCRGQVAIMAEVEV